MIIYAERVSRAHKRAYTDEKFFQRSGLRYRWPNFGVAQSVGIRQRAPGQALRTPPPSATTQCRLFGKPNITTRCNSPRFARLLSSIRYRGSRKCTTVSLVKTASFMAAV